MALGAEPSARRPKVLSVEALEKTYGAVKVLNQISLDMEYGEFLVLVGPSGCGKSTLLNCIAGLDEVTGGRILIGDRDVTKVPPRDRDIAMVFQSYALYPTMTVAENIAFGMKVRGLPKREQQKKTEDVAKLLQLDHLLNRKPAHLSGGQRQRVAMGRALVREPVLFLFDEPLSNLDAKLRVEMRAEIKSLHQRLRASIVYVTHDQIEAMTLGTKIVVLNAGVIQQIGTPQDIYRRPANLFVADFMGSPPMNLLSATCRLDEGGARLMFGEGGKVLHDPQPPGGLSRYDGKPVVVGVRPEDITQGPPGINQVMFEVLGVENAGSDNFVSLRSSGKPITARMPGAFAISPGETIGVNIPPASLCYFDPETRTRIS